MRKMGLTQFILLGCALLICFTEFLLLVLKGIMLNFFLVFLMFFLCFVIITVKYSMNAVDNKERVLMIVTGIRNLLTVFSLLVVLSGISTWKAYDGNRNITFAGITYNHINAFIALGINLGAVSIYLIIKGILYKKLVRINENLIG